MTGAPKRAKYRKKKSEPAASLVSGSSAERDADGDPSAEIVGNDGSLLPVKRVPPGSLKLQFAGELLLVKRPAAPLLKLFRRFEALFEALANFEKSERLLIYRFLAALMLTSHAKKAEETPEKKRLFDLKNDIFLSIANDEVLRRKVAFRYLTSRNVRVLEHCPKCTAENTEAGRSKYVWRYCAQCKVDRNFYNVLAMRHTFDGGLVTIFLSDDLISKVRSPNLSKRGRLSEQSEEAVFENYRYNARNLDAFDRESVLELHRRIIV